MNEINIQNTIYSLFSELHPNRMFGNLFLAQQKTLHIKDHVIPLKETRKVAVCGLGKAAHAQVLAVRKALKELSLPIELLPSHIVTKYGHGDLLEEGEGQHFEAGHPVPDEASFRAGESLARYFEALSQDALILFCLSGGGSALADILQSPFSQRDVQLASKSLLGKGATIEETNLIRQVMSRFKNGGLLTHLGGKELVTLVTSDVPTDDLGVVASGPTIYRPAEVPKRKALAKGFLPPDLAEKICQHLDSSQRQAWVAIVEEASRVAHQSVIQVAGFQDLMVRTKDILNKNGYPKVTILNEPFNCSVADGILRLKQALPEAKDRTTRWALVSGGEMPVQVQGGGKGGRNTEFVLQMAKELFADNPDPWKDVGILSAGTDGQDGPTLDAGGWLDYDSFLRSRTLGISLEESLKRNDSHTFLSQLDQIIHTGPTQTNLMDLRILFGPTHS